MVETIFPAFGFSDASIRITTILIANGLIPNLIFAWAFERPLTGLPLVCSYFPVDPRSLDALVKNDWVLGLEESRVLTRKVETYRFYIPARTQAIEMLRYILRFWP